MRTLTIFALLLGAFCARAELIVSNWNVGTFTYGVPAAAAGGGACATSDTTNSWDDFLEGFQTATTGYEEANWTEVGTTANIDSAYDSSTLTTYKPEGACDQALRIVVPNDSTETHSDAQLDAEITVGTTQTDIYYSFYIESELATGKQVTMFTYRSSSLPSASQGVQLGNTAGQSWVFAIGAANSSQINVADGQWNTVKLSLDTAGAAGGSTITVYSNGSVVGTETFTRSSENIEYLFIGGCVGVSSGEEYTGVFDLIQVKTN